MRIFAFKNKRNVGDTLTLPLVRYILPDVTFTQAKEKDRGKLVGVGSILNNVRRGDAVWGTGAMFANETVEGAANVRFLAVRGKLSEGVVTRSGGIVSGVTGDPALLLPRLYSPAPQKRFKVGVIPHFIDYATVGRNFGWEPSRALIDPFLPWQEFVVRVLECERIVSSSLHGLVIAEAYGIPAEWREWSKNVRGDGFKFRDYLTGTGRAEQGPGKFPPIDHLSTIQDRLIDALSAILR
jgi:pyruvyltransferase